MKKELKDKLRRDPIKWERYKRLRREAKRRKYQRIKDDPSLYENYRSKCRRRNEKRVELNRRKRLVRYSQSPYFQRKMGWDRYKCHTFQILARNTNRRCKINKVTAQDLWSIAKNKHYTVLFQEKS